MIVTIRSWHLARDDYAEFARVSEEEFWPAFDTLDGRALGLWAVRVGGPERVVVMTRYRSLEHWLGTRAWGPAADRLQALSAKRDRMIRDTDMLAMRPVSRRQPERDAPEPGAGVYAWETFRIATVDIERFREITEDTWAPSAERGGSVRLVGIWRSYVGPQNRVYMLTRADGIGAWEAGGDADASLARSLGERAAFSERLSVQLLYPITRRRP